MSESESGECESIEEINSGVALPELDEEECSPNPSRAGHVENRDDMDDED